MKTNLASAFTLSLSNGLRTVAIVASLLVLPAFASANNTAPADRAAELLALSGSVPVKNAGPYVETGTFRIQVATTLGRPGAVLADGTWLYPNREIADTDVKGTLVVKFDAKGQVSNLSLVTPAVATAMTAPLPAAGKILVANRQ